MIGKVGQNSRIVVIKDAVRVKVPVESPDMEFRCETPSQSGGIIPERWHNAFSVGKIIVNRNFYGITKADLGETVTATVQIYEKTVGDRKYTALDIFKANGTRPTCGLKILESAVGDAYPIQGAVRFICFK